MLIVACFEITSGDKACSFDRSNGDSMMIEVSRGGRRKERGRAIGWTDGWLVDNSLWVAVLSSLAFLLSSGQATCDLFIACDGRVQ